jgi:hypothetical protein
MSRSAFQWVVPVATFLALVLGDAASDALAQSGEITVYSARHNGEEPAYAPFTQKTGIVLLGANVPASEGPPGPPEPLKYLAGCFEVSYRFVEDGVHDKDIRGDLLEEITLEDRDSVWAFQHWGVFKGRRIKHWREEWRQNPDGSFTQTVIGPFENFRYECTAPFRFNQWRCTTPDAPKPQRDRERRDYQVLDRENALQITPKGWVHSENNVKRTTAGRAIANELGWNEYRRVDTSRCRSPKSASNRAPRSPRA